MVLVIYVRHSQPHLCVLSALSEMLSCDVKQTESMAVCSPAISSLVAPTVSNTFSTTGANDLSDVNQNGSRCNTVDYIPLYLNILFEY